MRRWRQTSGKSCCRPGRLKFSVVRGGNAVDADEREVEGRRKNPTASRAKRSRHFARDPTWIVGGWEEGGKLRAEVKRVYRGSSRAESIEGGGRRAGERTKRCKTRSTMLHG